MNQDDIQNLAYPHKKSPQPQITVNAHVARWNRREFLRFMRVAAWSNGARLKIEEERSLVFTDIHVEFDTSNSTYREIEDLRDDLRFALLRFDRPSSNRRSRISNGDNRDNRGNGNSNRDNGFL